MITLHKEQRGALNALLIPLILVSMVTVLIIVFAVWAYGQMSDYKNNSDQKSADAVSLAVKKEDAKKAVEYAEAAKSPLKTYSGPAAYGSLHVEYPKTWSAYVIEQNTSGNSVDGYFNPNFVPFVSDSKSSFALRVRVLGTSYASTMQSFQGLIKSGKLTAAPYAFAKVPGTVGTKLTGQIVSTKQGTMIVIPLRASTLEVWTETSAAAADFNTYVLPNLSFSP
jgi:hypothetical protein